MTDALAVLVAISGIGAGVVQAGLLARSAGRPHHPLASLGRIAVGAVALLVAARAGHLAIGAAAWMAGFVATGAVVLWRMR